MASQRTGRELCFLEEGHIVHFKQIESKPYYGIFFLSGRGQVTIDFSDFHFQGNVVLFATPWQFIRIETTETVPLRIIWFHGDYYCIEYHKKEVACNGLLFNNIYTAPFICLDDPGYRELQELTDRLQAELPEPDDFSRAVARSYLQLILAISSKAKMTQGRTSEALRNPHPVLEFKNLLEQHFTEERRPSFYAAELGLSPNAFSKRCKLYFHKTPSVLIQERVILEAKKQIHLTVKSMKEIATSLNFQDENYFSRYFKKHTGISPTAFREHVGVSVVAFSSMK